MARPASGRQGLQVPSREKEAQASRVGMACSHQCALSRRTRSSAVRLWRPEPRGLSPEALRRRTPNTRWPGSAQVGTSLRADILFLESLTDADTRSSGYQDQDLGPCGHGHASHGHPPLLVHRRVCIPYIHCNSSTRTRNGIKYIQYICALT